MYELEFDFTVGKILASPLLRRLRTKKRTILAIRDETSVSRTFVQSVTFEITIIVVSSLQIKDAKLTKILARIYNIESVGRRLNNK